MISNLEVEWRGGGRPASASAAVAVELAICKPLVVLPPLASLEANKSFWRAGARPFQP